MIKADSGLKAPRIADEMLKLMRIAKNDWRNVMFNPSSGASIAFSKALPNVVSKMTSGNLIAV